MFFVHIKSCSAFLFLFACFLLSQNNLKAQQSFSADPVRIEVEKPANYDFFYDYSDLKNLTDTPLNMRWVIIEETLENFVNGTVDNPVGNWSFGMSDPSNDFLPSTDIDSADFVLDTLASNANKLIHQIFPNGDHGIAKTIFRVFPIDEPEEYIDVSFKYTALQVVNTEEASLEQITTRFDAESQMLHLYNPSKQNISYQLIQLNGAILYSGQLNATKNHEIALPNRKNSIVFIVLSSEGTSAIRKIYLFGR